MSAEQRPARPFRRITGVFFLGLMLVGCRGATSKAAVTAPNFELKDLSGKTVNLESFKGHPVLLDFWATWCGPCRLSIPMVQALYAHHKAEGFMVVGMNMDDDPSQVYPFVKHFGMTYPVLYGGASNVMNDYQVDGLPTFVFIDADGRIVQRFDGFSMDMPQAWEAEIESLTAKTK